ncbi:MAG: DnaJ domain-containing protein, partial [Monoraphidium minutum]
MGAERRVDGAAGEPVAQEAPATLYERLGVDLHAPDERIRAAYIRLAKQTHPDRHRGGDWLSAQRRFQRIQEAYEVLMDPERRSALRPAAAAPHGRRGACSNRPRRQTVARCRRPRAPAPAGPQGKRRSARRGPPAAPTAQRPPLLRCRPTLQEYVDRFH